MMKWSRVPALTAVMLAGLIALGAAAGQVAQEELDALVMRIAELENKTKQLESSVASLEEQVKALEGRLAAVSVPIKDTEKAVLHALQEAEVAPSLRDILVEGERGFYQWWTDIRTPAHRVSFEFARWRAQYRIDYKWMERSHGKTFATRGNIFTVAAAEGATLRATHPVEIKGDFLLVLRGRLYRQKGGGRIGLAPRDQWSKELVVEMPLTDKPFTLTIARTGGRIYADLDGKKAYVKARFCDETFEGHVALFLTKGNRLELGQFELYVMD